MNAITDDPLRPLLEKLAAWGGNSIHRFIVSAYDRHGTDPGRGQLVEVAESVLEDASAGAFINGVFLSRYRELQAEGKVPSVAETLERGGVRGELLERARSRPRP